MNKWFWIFAGTYWGIALLLIGGFFIMINTSCEREYDAYPNHIYTFSYLVDKDQYGIETWGAHHFVVKDKITNIESFKECYANYLCWGELDNGCEVKKIYYRNRNHVKITYIGKSPALTSLTDINNCQ